MPNFNVLIENRDVIMQAPALFLLVCLVVIVSATRFLYWFLSSKLRSENSYLKAQISYLNDHINHQHALHSTNVDMLKGIINFLQKQLDIPSLNSQEEPGKENSILQKQIEDLRSQYIQRFETVRDTANLFQQQLEVVSKNLELHSNMAPSKDEIKALEFISKIDDYKEPGHGFPAHCHVDDLAKVLKVEYGDANEIIGNLKRMGLVSSLFENVATFHNPLIPLNEEKPVRITRRGIKFLETIKNRQQSGS